MPDHQSSNASTVGSAAPLSRLTAQTVPFEICDPSQLTGEVMWFRSMHQYREVEPDLLRHMQPVKVVTEWHDVVELPRAVDQPGGSIEDRLK